MQRTNVLDYVIEKISELLNYLDDMPENAEEISQTKIVALYGLVADEERSNLEKLHELAEGLKQICALHLGDYQASTLLLVSEMLNALATSMQTDDWEQSLEECDSFTIYKNSVSGDYGSIYYQNSTDDANRMLMLVCKEEEIVNKFIEDENSKLQELLLLTLYHIDFKDQFDVLLLAPKNLDEQSQKKRIEFAKLNAVLNGKTFNSIPKYSSEVPPITVSFDDDIDYDQFTEIIDVMNEYNMQEYTLDKFLRIYQVIENFMFKNLICAFCKEHNYRKLTVRDFKDISVEMSKSEEGAMQTFLEGAGKIPIGTSIIEDLLFANWNTLIESVPANKSTMNYTIQKLSVRSKKNDIFSIDNMDKQKVLSLFGKLIYRFRCSIVHNKVNEYHITYVNLDNKLRWVLEEYLIPSMEKLVYELMLNKNDIVMFTQKELQLY